MSGLSFTTAKAERGPSGNTLKRFDVDGEPYAAARPKDEAFLLIMQAASKQATMPDQVHGTFQFLDHCFEPDALMEAINAEAEADELLALELEENRDLRSQLLQSGTRLRDRLLDRHDDMDTATLGDIMRSLVEEWTGRPTGSPRDSSTSRPAAGSKSTVRSSSKVSTGSTSSSKTRRVR